MSEAAFTPGPWSVHGGDYCGARIDGPNGRGVAHATQRDAHPTIGQGITQAEAEANARLLAAAPELLEALLLMCRSRGSTNPIPDESHYAAAYAAIAKAEGL